jgi:dihydrolipoamide dehydrogenase
MVVGNVPEAVDLVVAGAGPGGYVAALRAAQAGRRVTLVDRDGPAGLGGACLTVGCIPSKALIEMGEQRARIARAGVLGVRVGTPEVDLAQFQRFKSDLIGRLQGGVRALLERARVEVVAGELALVDEKTVVINRRDGSVTFFAFKDLLLATGSSPLALPQLPFDGDAVLDSSGVLALETLPASIAIVGAGYIGIELGIALAKLGSRVSVIEREECILPGMDAALAEPVRHRLRELGIELFLAAEAGGFAAGELEFRPTEGTPRRVAVDKVVVSVGRRPNSAGIGLREAGLALSADGTLPVAADRRLAAHIAAVGDLTPGPALAHKAMAEAEVAVAALGGKRVAFDPAAIPEVVFSDPEIASAGLTTVQAQAMGADVLVARFPFAASGRAAILGERRGFAQVIADKQDGAVLGVHIVGPHASDLIAEGVLAIEMGARLEDLALSIHPHPTLSEPLAEAAHIALGAPLHFMP